MIIDRFTGDHAFLSNFYPSVVQLDDAWYPTVENAYQAAKTLDPNLRKPFERCIPSAAKKRGKLLRNLVPRWDEKVRFQVMEQLLRQKFSPERASMALALLRTGDAELIEGNTWHDKVWGRCTCPTCHGLGENHLGRLLMKIRAEFQ